MTTTTPAKKTATAKKAASQKPAAQKQAAKKPAAKKAPPAKKARAANPTTKSASSSDRPMLRNISEVRHFFRTNEVPIYFVGATPFNLLGLDRWVRNFSYVAYYDGWDGAHPRVFTPKHKPYTEFSSGEEINNWLLVNPEVRAHIAGATTPGIRPKLVMVFFDAETERICAELGYDLILPSAALREHLDSKLVTTRLGNDVGAASVPNIMTTVEEYDELVTTATEAGLGTDLVVQSAYGDSGKTTFFIDDESGWKKHRKDIIGQEVKVMKRINNRPIAVEAVLTSSGTVVGPFMTELTGHAKLTPYRGGWCGNEMFPEVLDDDLRVRAAELVAKLGERLGAEGYRGFFEVDVLIDTDTDDVYLGELNPRISGASAITNVTAGAYADIPLFAFHLLEFMDVDFDLDVEEINERWRALAADDQWSHMIIKETSPIVQLITASAVTGQYYLDAAGSLVYRRPALDWHQLQNQSEVFFLRIYGAGDYRWKGADLGVLVTKGRLQRRTEGGADALTIRAKHLIDSVRAQYLGMSLSPVAPQAPSGQSPAQAAPSAVK